MPDYRLYFFRPPSHAIVRFETIEAASDQAAIGAMQAHRGEFALELWHGTTKIDAEEATGIASRAMALRDAAAPEELSNHHPALLEAS